MDALPAPRNGALTAVGSSTGSSPGLWLFGKEEMSGS